MNSSSSLLKLATVFFRDVVDPYMQFRFITLPRNGGIWQNKTERLVFRLNLDTSKQYQSEIRHNAKPTGEEGGGGGGGGT